jgi:hypothetical protein
MTAIRFWYPHLPFHATIALLPRRSCRIEGGILVTDKEPLFSGTTVTIDPGRLGLRPPDGETSGAGDAMVAAYCKRWWRTAGHVGLHTALPNSYFDRIGVPRLAS